METGVRVSATPTAEAMRDIYDRHGAAFDATRTRALGEEDWLLRVAAALPPGGEVLDLGCGAGEPVAAWFIARGYGLTGLDYSATMLDLARRRFPERAVPRVAWLQGDMRALDLGRRVDAVIGWDSFFHLDPGDQRRTLGRIADHLHPGGVLLLTVGADAGEAIGSVGGEPVYHSSLGESGYRAALADLGLATLAFARDDARAGRTVLFARKP
jgi:SAM-dependent methyltransferase